MSFANRWAIPVAVGSGATCAAFGALVLTGWHSGNLPLASGFLPGPPTGYLTAAALLLAGAGLVAAALGRPRLALPAGTFAIAAAAGDLASRVFGPGSGVVGSLLQAMLTRAPATIDPLGDPAWIQLGLIGAALTLLGREPGPRRAPLVGTLAAALATLGLAACFGHLTGVDASMHWTKLTGLPLAAGLAVTLAGAALLAGAWRESMAASPTLPRWTPVLVAAAGITATIVLWQALSADRRAQLDGATRTVAAQVGEEATTAVTVRVFPLVRMAERWERHGAPSRDGWEFDAERLITHLTGYDAIGWADPALLVRWVVPAVGEPADELRRLSHGAAQARVTDAALARGGPALSRVEKLPDGTHTLTVLVPIGSGRLHRGWIVGVLDIERWAASDLKVIPGRGQVVSLWEGEREIFRTHAEGRIAFLKPIAEVPVPIFDRLWRVRIWAAPGRLSDAVAQVPIAILVVGLLLSMLTALAVHWAATARLREREALKAYEQLAVGTGQWRLAERAQRRSEERFQLVTRATSDALWNWDLPTGDLWWSPGFYALFHYPAEHVERGIESKTGRLHPADRERVMSSLERAISGGEDVWSAEYRFRCGDGAYAHVSDRAFILRDPAGRADRLFGSMIDVTARRQAEEERDRFFTLSPDLLCLAGSDGYLKRVNPAWTELLGYTETELLSRPSLEFVHPEDRAATEAATRQIAAGEAVVAYENRYRRKDGAYRWLHWRARHVVEQQIVYAFARDVTEEKRIERELAAARDQALQSVNAKSAFLANMSHEIRTPMNGVIGMCELLMETPLDTTQRRYADTIHASADSLLTILDDILDFSKSEAGKLALAWVPFDLRRTAEDALDLFARRAQTKGLELVGLVHRDVPRALLGDPARLRQVIANLVGNAVKFTERGMVALEATLVEEAGGRAVVRIEVRDTGIGISEEGRAALFASFSQVDPSSTRRHGGTGLGLAICKQLVELMGGTIGVESHSGRGSTFWFTVPLERAPEGALGEAPDLAPLVGRRVLLVQENATSRRMLRHVLESWSLEVVERENGADALDALRRPSERFDFVLFDLYLPDLDGLTLSEGIAKLLGAGAPALVLMTPIGSRDEISRMTNFAACLAKPVLPSQLLECLLGLVATQGRAARAPEAAAVAPGPGGEPEAGVGEEKSRGNRILVVDDNAVNLHVALGQLESHGYVAEVVSNGRDALTALEQNGYDLVLMDCQMPEMDGFQATQEIRRREGADRKTIVVAMTAHALEGDRQRCLDAGMDDYIAKPIRGAELDRVIRRWLGLGAAPPRDAGVPRARGSEAPLVDMTLLRDAFGSDEAKLRDLLQLYFRQMAESVPRLGAAIAAGSAEEVRQIAHKLAGSSASCGILAVVPLLRDLERMGKEGRITEAPRAFAELEKRLEGVRARLAEYAETPPLMSAAG